MFLEQENHSSLNVTTANLLAGVCNGGRKIDVASDEGRSSADRGNVLDELESPKLFENGLLLIDEPGVAREDGGGRVVGPDCDDFVQ